MADTMETGEKEGVKSSASSSGKEMESVEHVSKLKNARKGKLSQLTKRKNIMLQLMEDVSGIQEVQENLQKYTQLIAEFKSVHKAYQEQLTEDDIKKDQCEWFEPKMTEINTFLSFVSEWLTGASKPSEAEPRVEEEVSAKDSVSQVSLKSRSSSVASARIFAEAERAAIMVKAAALKEKHDLEAQESALQNEMQALKQKREAFELKTQLAISSSKIAILTSAEEQQGPLITSPTEETPGEEPSTGPAIITQAVGTQVKQPDEILQSEGKDSMNAYFAEMSMKSATAESEFLSLDKVTQALSMMQTPSVRPKDGVHFQSIQVEEGVGIKKTTSSPLDPLRRSDPSKTASSSDQSIKSNDGLANILQRQNDITSILVKQQQHSKLPQREIPVFSGDVLLYRPFIRAFEHTIELKTDNSADRLYFLDQYTSGLPRDLVRSCLHMSPDTGYEKAKVLLQEHYGDEFKICSAYLKKALEWPVIKTEDSKALQVFVLFLRSCCNAMQEMRYSQEINLSSNLKALIMKLPYKFRERWRCYVCEFQERQNNRPQFPDLVSFLEKQVRVVSDPVYGDIQDRPTRTLERQSNKTKPSKSTGASFATSVSTSSSHLVPHSKSNLTQTSCPMCNTNHTLDCCSALMKRKHKEKLDFLKEKGICFGCLHQGHISKHCKQRLTCRVCSKQHPSVLHIETKQKTHQQEKGDVSEAVDAVDGQPKACGHIGAGTGAGNVLSVLPVRVKAGKGERVITVYAFIDPGSSATFCTERLMSQLNVKGRRTNILLQTMSHETSVPTYVVSGLEVSGLDENNFVPLPDVFTQKEMPVTTDNIPTKQDLARWPYLQKVNIPVIDSRIELLIGTNASKIIEPWEIINSQGEGPYAVRTLVGWVVNGPLRHGKSAVDNDCQSAAVNRISVANLERLLISHYNHDFNEKTSDERREPSIEDKRFLEIANNSVSLIDGHYTLNLPFRHDDVQLPNNRHIAMQRLQSLKRKLKRSESFHDEYSAFLSDVIAQGYAEVVPQEELEGTEGRIWYIPHHGVYHPKKNTLRVVFDCGAVYQGRSLNSELLQGPDLTNSLIGVLLRFRREPIALMADIRSMFHQVRVSKSDIDFLRFLWWTDGNIEQDPIDYRMLVHLFGAASSPSCASFALRRTAEDNLHMRSQVTNTIMHNFYVDDCLTSLPTVQDAVQLTSDLVELCSKGGFQLTKWVSNNRVVLSNIKAEERGKDIRSLDLDKDQLPVDRALGLQWSVENDDFRFNIVVPEKPHTRRGILSMISSVYDPLGILAPLTLPAKQLLQQLCKQGYGWDEPIPPSQSKHWADWIKDLPTLVSFNVPRCIKPPNFKNPVIIQLHHFADASELGYGVVSYVRMSNDQGGIHVCFLMGKARVAPLKQLTIPRLELAAAVLSVKVDKLLRTELHLPLQSSMFWVDSQAVLKYIASDSARFYTFVANRVAFIRENTSIQQWKFIESKHNPADDASRGLSAQKFLDNKRWLCGPPFLWEPNHTWPTKGIDSESLPHDDPEVKCPIACNVVIQDPLSPTNKLLSFFSDWTRLMKAVAWYQKLGDSLLALSAKRKQLSTEVTTRSRQQNAASQLQAFKLKLGGQCISLGDLERAEKAVLSFTQRKAFPDECEKLATMPPCVPKRSKIYRLDPILKDGLLKVGGRLSRAAMSETMKHPIILPKQSHISSLLLRHIHERYGHCGRNYILSQLRKKYWVVSANSAARRIISKCVTCRRLKTKTAEQKMANLPFERTRPNLPPFTNVGMDYFGPIVTKRGRSLLKRYGVIFTCLSCRAIHLEIAYSLDTDSCIHAIRRFVCRRGQVQHIWSDNGTNLVGAEKELKRALSSLNNDRIQGTLLKRGISWTFNPPGASHHGGVWERLIRSVRWVLSALLHQQSLTDEGLQTLFCEVEAILNNRPITTASSDPFDLEPLTPNHILLLNTQPVLPPGEFSRTDLYTRRRWKQVQYLADLFWRRWTQEYLTLMQERQKWSKVRENLKVGDVVVIVDPTSPRSSWPLARILETKPDSNGLVRSVKLKTKTGVVERPITKLCLLLEDAH